MSKLNQTFALIFMGFLQSLQFFTIVPAQNPDTTIVVDARSGPNVIVSGKNFREGQRNLSFERSIAGIDNLDGSISEVSFFDKSGSSVLFKKLTEGEYVAESVFASWTYKIDLAPLKNRSASAHISWMTADNAVLMLADILPKLARSGNEKASIQVLLPERWKRSPRDLWIDPLVTDVKDLADSVIVAGESVRFADVTVKGSNMELAVDGEWLFADSKAAELAREIFEEYVKLFGRDPAIDVQISIIRFPNAEVPGNWEAETRGKNITIISSDMPFKSQSEQRLHEQLRHEIFHLWLPAGVELTGNYDWFYEGFALYQSLKTGVLLNRISFADFLDTLSRAHNIDNLAAPKISLIEASKSRWSGSNTQVYARGMLVAFLCDVALLQESKGRREVADIFREIYASHRTPNAPADGNTVVLSSLREYPGLVRIIEKYISGSQKIEWQTELLAAGIDGAAENGRTNLKVLGKMSRRQKDLLDKLGYNSWRKLSRKSK